jgi:hypothetical protein
MMKAIIFIIFIIITSLFPLIIEAQIQPQQAIRNLFVSQPSPPLLVATEEEVKQFLVNYIDRYTQKDLDGFLLLFSSRAVQNHRDGLEGIRTIYTNYFNQSQEIRYQMEDTKIEIYQNAVEVKARYEVDQILRKEGEKKVWKGHIRLVLVKEKGALKILSLDYQHQKTP